MDIKAEGIGAILIMILVVAVPIKAGAHWVDAKKTDILSCAIAAVVGVVASHLASTYLGATIGGPVAGFLGFILAIRFVLGTSFGGAIILSIVAIGVSILGTTILSGIL